MKKKGILKRALLLALVIITVLSCAAVAFAAGWNGDVATGGSASSTASGAYAILRGGTAESMIVGFRFSGRLSENVNEKPDEDIQSIDVILKEEEYNISLLGKMSPQYSKADYFQIACKSDNEIEAGNIVYMQSDAIWGDNDHTYMESELEADFRTNLPHDSTNLSGDLDAWQQWDENLDVITTSISRKAFGCFD